MTPRIQSLADLAKASAQQGARAAQALPNWEPAFEVVWQATLAAQNAAQATTIEEASRWAHEAHKWTSLLLSVWQVWHPQQGVEVSVTEAWLEAEIIRVKGGEVPASLVERRTGWVDHGAALRRAEANRRQDLLKALEAR